MIYMMMMHTFFCGLDETIRILQYLTVYCSKFVLENMTVFVN
jgi:hypothetical protein